ncbi:hypothetical protein SK128_000785 [Halocaridina rubra]|uniref:Uncharacterized protein n=1 Tax=Halocaridina rubra TaxID=373956 RepID=A0AAN8X4K5_HALRR
MAVVSAGAWKRQTPLVVLPDPRHGYVRFSLLSPRNDAAQTRFLRECPRRVLDLGDLTLDIRVISGCCRCHAPGLTRSNVKEMSPGECHAAVTDVMTSSRFIGAL